MMHTFFLSSVSFQAARLCHQAGEPTQAESCSDEVGQFIVILKQHGFVRLSSDQTYATLCGFSNEQYEIQDWVIAIKAGSSTVDFSMRSLATGRSVTRDSCSCDEALSIVGIYTNTRFVRSAVSEAYIAGVGREGSNA